jgi:AcrR family transcriptional regulator
VQRVTEGATLAGGTSTRGEQKARTRRALLDATLKLLENESFDKVSLRKVTSRAGVVPTAFYRHFDGMEALGLALVDEAFGTLRDMLRAVREETTQPEWIIRRSVEVLVQHVHDRPTHFRFIAREWHGGSRVLREAIQEQLDEFTEDLADDLAAFPYIVDWSRRDQLMLANLIVTVMVDIAAQLLDHPEAEDAIVHRAKQQVLLIVMAVPQWESR